MKITEISIENIKGISKLELKNIEIFPNKPNIIVAHNGYGKTSIATSFKSVADKTSVNLTEEQRYLTDAKKKASIRIVHNKICYNANESPRSNEIRAKFDIFVLSDLRKLKAIAPKYKGFQKAKASLVINDIVIDKKVDAVKSPYSHREFSKDISCHRNFIKNIKLLIENKKFIDAFSDLQQEFSILEKKRHSRAIEEIEKQLVDSELTPAVSVKIENFVKNSNVITIKKLISMQYANCCNGVLFVTILQLMKLWTEHQKVFCSLIKYLEYKKFKEKLKINLNNLYSAWQEVKICESKGNLIIQMPNPQLISNGQRDSLILWLEFEKIKRTFKKDCSILVIDELFDYLDDANITVAQYHISKLCEFYKNKNKSIYVILLTHLNPTFFSNYTFSNQNVIYLTSCDISNIKNSPSMKKLLTLRSKKGDLASKIDLHLMHYHNDGTIDFSDELSNTQLKNLKSSWGNVSKFKEYILEEFQNYIDGRPFDPFAICVITRIAIEKIAYDKVRDLADPLRKAEDIYAIHTTKKKIQWARESGAELPETCDLLSIIFNDGLHWTERRDCSIAIYSKLSNFVIQKMIMNLVEMSNYNQ